MEREGERKKGEREGDEGGTMNRYNSLFSKGLL